MGVLSFRFWFLCFWNSSFRVFILDAIFCGIIFFFIFQDSVWLVKKSWWVHCCSIHQFYWLSDRCRSRFALWSFFIRKNCRHKLVVSTIFWSWLLNVSSVLTTKKIHCDIFFGLLKRCGQAGASWEYYVFDFGFYDSEICHFLCLFLMRSFVVQFFFHFSGHCVAS